MEINNQLTRLIKDQIPYVTIGYRNADYVIDGYQDDVQINEAIEDLSSTGGAILLQELTYNISSSIFLKNNISILGSGKGSVLKLVDGSNTNVISTSGTDLVYFCTLSNLKIEGNKSNNTSGHSLYMRYAHSWVVENMHIDNSPDNGIKIEGSHSNNLALNNIVRNCRIEDSGNQGVFVSGYAPNNHLLSNIVGGTDNFYCMEISNDEIILKGNHVHGASSTCIYVNGGKRCVLVGNIAESGGGNGIQVENTSTDCIVNSNMCFNNGTDGIRIGGDNNIIMGNRCLNKSGTNQDYGINVVSGAESNVVIGNILTGNNSGGLLDNGTSTATSGNVS